MTEPKSKALVYTPELQQETLMQMQLPPEQQPPSLAAQILTVTTEHIKKQTSPTSCFNGMRAAYRAVTSFYHQRHKRGFNPAELAAAAAEAEQARSTYCNTNALRGEPLRETYDSGANIMLAGAGEMTEDTPSVDLAAALCSLGGQIASEPDVPKNMTTDEFQAMNRARVGLGACQKNLNLNPDGTPKQKPQQAPIKI